MSRVLALLAAATLALSACGDAEQGAGGSSELRGKVTPEPAAEDLAAGKASTLQPEDFPAGWTSTPANDAPDMITKCKGFEDAKALSTARADAPDYEDASESFAVIDSVYMYPDATAAENGLAMMRGAEMHVCFGEEIGRVAATQGQGVELGEVTSTPLDAGMVGDEVDAGRIKVPLTIQGETLDMTIDLVLLRGGRGISFLAFMGYADPFDDELRAQLTEANAKRLAANAQ